MNFEGVRVVMTYGCNRNCKMCYQKTKESVCLDPIKYEEILKDIKSKDIIPTYFTIQGGEVTTEKEATIKLASLTDEYFPQVFRKSITTNGDGDIAFYESLSKYGITNITFSLHQRDSIIEDKILKIAHNGFFTVRVNCFMEENNFDDIFETIYPFCVKNNIPLTLCEDLIFGSKDINSDVMIQTQLKDAVPTFHKHQTVWRDVNFRFWVYKHQDQYDYNNLIVLPNGTVTMTFDDVIVGKGAFNEN